ncbi:Phosphoenolpyruvate synthase [compost metagenome]
MFATQSGNKPIAKSEAIAEVERQYEASKKILSKLNDERLDVLCDLMGRIGVFRDVNKAKLGETVVRRIAILEEISRRREIPLEDVNLYLMSELTNLLENNVKLSADVLNDRRKEGVSFVRSEDATSPISISITAADKKSFLPGICASPGKIRGAIKVVHSKEDINKINPSDIMVAIGTDFDLLEIMNMCSGIITEEGGLLSHASVVSRELKKPCLIGVANATKILKDGDSVLLDATEGKINLE